MTHSNPYRAMMDYLDNLVKSRFIEMFNSFSPSKKVKEVCSFLSRGKSAHYCEDSEYYIIGQACIRTNCIEFDRVRCMDPTKYVPKFELRYGDVLINSTGVGSLGRCNKFYNPDGRTYVTDSHVTILRLNLEMINPDYIRHYINLDKVQAEIYAKCVNGSTNQIELNKGDFSNFMIPLPPISLQNKFSDFVKQVDKSKAIVQKCIDKYDQLVKSRFIEMFEEYIYDKKCVPLESLCNTFVDGDWIESKDQDTSGIRLIQTGNVGISTYLDKADKARFINEETFERLNCTEVLPGDILISRLPDPIARSCIVPEGLGKSITGVDCTIVRLKDDVNPIFFNTYTISNHYLSQVSKFEAGSTRKRISRKNLGKIMVPLPPIALQNQFSLFVEQVDKSKFYSKGLKNTLLMIQYSMIAVAPIIAAIRPNTPAVWAISKIRSRNDFTSSDTASFSAAVTPENNIIVVVNNPT